MRNKNAFLLRALALAASAVFVQAIVCPQNICERVRCQQKDCAPGQVSKAGGFCGCCQQCFTTLGENADCSVLSLSAVQGVPPPPIECGDGLICHEGVCRLLKDVISTKNRPPGSHLQLA